MRAVLYLEEERQKIALVGGVALSDEIILIEKAKDFDSEAWTEIYKRYYHKIYVYLGHKLGNMDLAEDMAATVFLEALERIETFTYRGIPLSAWLYRIAHNMMVEHFRHRAKVHTEPLTEDLILETAEPDEVIERNLARQDLTMALKKLTDEQRQVILLKFMAGLTNTEVARVINKPVGAIKSLQHRALVSLRRIIGGEVT